MPLTEIWDIWALNFKFQISNSQWSYHTSQANSLIKNYSWPYIFFHPSLQNEYSAKH